MVSLDLTRHKNSVKSLLLQFGIDIPERTTDSPRRGWPENYMEWLKELPEGSEGLRAVAKNYVETGMQIRKHLGIWSGTV